MSGNRITRKEIKRDELVETISGLTAAFENHSRSLLIAIGSVVVLGAAVAGGIWYSRSSAEAALTQLGSVQKAAAALLADQEAGSAPADAARQKSEEVIRRADALLSKHPGSEAARWASYYKALGQKGLANHAGALETLKPLLSGSKDDFLTASSQVLEAQVKEAQGDLAGASAAYGALAASAPSLFPVDLALSNQARLLKVQGKKDEAADVYRRLSQEFPDSPFAREANEELNPKQAPRS